MRGVEHAGPVQRLVGVRRPLDVQLIARRAVERVLLVRTDLGVDVEGAEERERPARNRGAREIEMQRDLPPAA